jgi:ubiquinone/menaquinone biosynthesis C-methylase UbiE
MATEKKVVYRVEDGMDREKILCTTYQMRNFYQQFHDGFFSNLDVMNYIQHFAAAHMAKKGMNIVDVCCGRSLMLPLLRYYAKDINSYTGVDISETNIREAIRGASKRLTEEEFKTYYPFKVSYKLGNVAYMSKYFDGEFADFVIYTSAVEHMHPDDGRKSLEECYKIMKPGAKIFLSCPNTPGNGYNTQYRAHVYEWGYDELKETVTKIGFKIRQEVGLVMGAREMDAFFSEQPAEIRKFYQTMAAYVPKTWLTAMMAIPYPKASREILFIMEK